MAKTYDRAYFEKWYRSRSRVISFNEVRRKVAMVVGNAEYFLRRPIRNVLDVGCGEAPWFVHLKALRPKVSYLGLDPSEYAVKAFASHRNVREGTFTDLSAATGHYDLVVCADVMHYLTDEEIRRGLPHLVKRMRGVAFLDVFTKEDSIVGDFADLHRRRAKWYRERFREAGLNAIGPYMWVAPPLDEDAAALEICN
jgi:SAM-dependent methyltransferase